MIGIATPPSGEMVAYPGVMVGRGLAIVQLPLPNDDGWRGYSITHVATGHRVPGARFFSKTLAMRCARHLTRIFSFEQATLEEVNADLYPLWRESLRPIVTRYLRMDDAWLERQEHPAANG